MGGCFPSPHTYLTKPRQHWHWKERLFVFMKQGNVWDAARRTEGNGYCTCRLELAIWHVRCKCRQKVALEVGEVLRWKMG